jgi:hypothetical protein
MEKEGKSVQKRNKLSFMELLFRMFLDRLRKPHNIQQCKPFYSLEDFGTSKPLFYTPAS